MVRWFRTGTGYRTGRINKHNVVRCCFFLLLAPRRWTRWRRRWQISPVVHFYPANGGRRTSTGKSLFAWLISVDMAFARGRDRELPWKEGSSFFASSWWCWAVRCFFFLTLLRTVGRSAFGGDKNYCVSCKRKLLAPRWWKSYLGRKKERCVVRAERQKVML